MTLHIHYLLTLLIHNITYLFTIPNDLSIIVNLLSHTQHSANTLAFMSASAYP